MAVPIEERVDSSCAESFAFRSRDVDRLRLALLRLFDGGDSRVRPLAFLERPLLDDAAELDELDVSLWLPSSVGTLERDPLLEPSSEPDGDGDD